MPRKNLIDKYAQSAVKSTRTVTDALANLTPMGDMSREAARASTLVYPKETELGGEADAMRHMLFQAEMADKYGEIPAHFVGLANEYLRGGLQSPAERRMDLDNDMLGRAFGRTVSDPDERMRMIIELIDSGGATTLKESELGYAHGGSVHGYAEGGSPIPTDPNQQALWEKYRVQTQSDKQDLLDRLDAASAVEQEVYKMNGMEPGLDRASILPFSGSRKQGNLQFAAPQMLYDLAKAGVAPGVAASGRQVSNEDALNTALNITGGSFGASHLAGPAAEAGKTMLGMAVKSKGGNWDIKSVEDFIDRIGPPALYTRAQAERQGFHVIGNQQVPIVRANQQVPAAGFVDENAPEVVVDTAARNWLNTKLNKYIRNEMGTPEDPVRLAHEEGYSHLPGDLEWLPPAGGNVELARQRDGYPEEGFSRYNYVTAGYPQAMEEGALKGEMWEALSDRAIVYGTRSAKEYQQIRDRNRRLWPEFVDKPDQNLWIDELNPKTPIYSMSSSSVMDDLGFQHIDDELRNMLNQNSGLPADLLLTPEQLKKVTMRSMVERVSKIKNWRTAEAERAERDGMMNNLSSTARFEDPAASLSFVEQPGMKWIDIPETTNEKGMKLCTTLGKQGGWCTQGSGLAKNYGSGRNRLVAMLDTEGRPHVQATLKSSVIDRLAERFSSLDPLARDEIRAVAISRDPRGGLNWAPNGRFLNGQGSDAANELMRQATLERFPEWNRAPPDITELKPVENSFNSNRANEYTRRDPKYKEKIGQSVLNFLNAGEWGKVADLGHYDIADLNDTESLTRHIKEAYGDQALDGLAKYSTAFGLNPNIPRFMSSGQLRQFINSADKEPGLAQGGSVRGYAQGGSVRGYAQGGSVHGYADGGSPTPTEPSFLGALKDPKFRSEVGNNFMTAANRGLVGMTLGAPVDIVNMATNLGIAGYGYLGNKLGLLSPEQMPALNNEPFGGSEWIGKQMERAGIIGDNRNLPAEIIAGSVLPFGFNALEARIPQMVRGLDQLAANYNALDDLNTGQYMGQRGAVKIKGGNWVTGSVDEALNPLKGFEAPFHTHINDLGQAVGAQYGRAMTAAELENTYGPASWARFERNKALNSWVDKTLAKYVKNDMSTPGDPLLAMADKYAVDKPAKLAEVQGRIDAFAAKMEQTARERGVPVEMLTSMRQQMIGLEKEKALVEARQALHFEPRRHGPGMREELRRIREINGFPGAGLGQSELAQRWETATDATILIDRAGDLIRPSGFRSDFPSIRLEADPWLSKVPPETPVYRASSMLTERTGFNHLVDELRNATDPESGLPKNLLIDPADLGKITVPQAVDRVADINAWRMAQKVEADKALANNPATFTHKEFPEQGMKWVQLRQPEGQLPDIGDMLVQNQGKYSIVEPGEKLGWKDPSSGRVLFDTPEAAADAYGKSKNHQALTDALKREGDIMAHSVGGYGQKGSYGAGGIDAILDGRASIFSLRDAEGGSYATIEVRKGKQFDTTRGLNQSEAQKIDQKLLKEYWNHFIRSGKDTTIPDNDFWLWLKQARPETYEAMTAGSPIIEQIKGVGNAAVEKKYWPLVQDFVESGTWSDVKDLDKAGLNKLNKLEVYQQKIANKIFPEKKYFSNNDIDGIDEEHSKWLRTKGYAQGGSVRGYAQGGSVRGYAQGGSVYDSNRVDTILRNITMPVQNLAEGGSTCGYDHGGSVHEYAEGGSMCGYDHGGSVQSYKQGGSVQSYAEGGSMCGYNHGGLVYDSNRVDAILSQFK
jgi:hypothetical protein